MIDNFGWFVFVMIGSIGWIFWLKELLKTFSNKNASSAKVDGFKTTVMAQQFGKIHFLKINWKNKEYFIAIDIQTGIITTIDKAELKEESDV